MVGKDYNKRWSGSSVTYNRKGELHMNEIFIEQQQVKLGDGREMKLRYYVTEELDSDSERLYGIMVKMLGEGMECEQTGPISESGTWVTKLCKKIARGLVTPMGLIYVVDDLVTEGSEQVRSA